MGVGMHTCVFVCECACMSVHACVCVCVQVCVSFSPSVPGFTGIDAVYEPPENPDLVLKAGEDSVDACVHSVLKLLQQHVRVMWGSCDRHVVM